MLEDQVFQSWFNNRSGVLRVGISAELLDMELAKAVMTQRHERLERAVQHCSPLLPLIWPLEVCKISEIQSQLFSVWLL